MRETADVVVVGAGIMGASIAYQLARRSDDRVIAVDKGAGPAEGATGASSSISRCRYTHPELIRLALHGQRAYASWAEFTGLDSPRSGLVQLGVLWMLGDPPAAVQHDVDRLVGEGVAARALSAQQVVERWPALSTCIEPFDLTGEVPHECRSGESFLFEETGGYADPSGATQDLIEAARREGAEVRFGQRVTGVRTGRGRVIGLELADGEAIDCPLVINAAGPWCNQLNAMAGVELRWTIDPTRVQVGYREWPADLGELPVTADNSTGIYFRPEAGGQTILFGSFLAEDEKEVVEDPDNFNRFADAWFKDLKIHALHHRIPELPHRGGVTGIAGLYDINREDVHPIVGPTDLEGFWCANGFSGHGFKLAPMIGSMIAQALTGVEAPFDTDVPIKFFAVDREPLAIATKHVLA